jgi:DNA repair protein RadC
LEDDAKPRERFLKCGAGVLGDKDLIAILIGSGTEDANALELAEKIMVSVAHDLKRLSRLRHQDLERFKGVGLAKSSLILAVWSLVEGLLIMD